MFVIGITGPSGAGKGEISKFLASRNIHVIDADTVYHDCITPPSRCLDELVRVFGRRILSGVGDLNRQELARLVFGEENREQLMLLNEITHKYVVTSIRKTVSGLRAVGADACAIDAPLLIEAGLGKDCDITLAVLAKRDIRAERISARDGIDPDRALKRIESQKPDEYYIENCKAVLYNNGALDTLIKEAEEVLRAGGVPI